MNVIQKIEHSLTLCEGGAAVNVKLKCIVGTNSMCYKCAKRVPTSDTGIYLDIWLEYRCRENNNNDKDKR